MNKLTCSLCCLGEVIAPAVYIGSTFATVALLASPLQALQTLAVAASAYLAHRIVAWILPNASYSNSRVIYIIREIIAATLSILAATGATFGILALMEIELSFVACLTISALSQLIYQLVMKPLYFGMIACMIP